MMRVYCALALASMLHKMMVEIDLLQSEYAVA